MSQIITSTYEVLKLIILYSNTYMLINVIHDTYLKRWTARIPIKGPLKLEHFQATLSVNIMIV